jgi:hypothetical protein
MLFLVVAFFVDILLLSIFIMLIGRGRLNRWLGKPDSDRSMTVAAVLVTILLVLLLCSFLLFHAPLL